MIMRRELVALLAAASLTSAAHAEDGRHLAVTVYNSGLALVEDTRVVDFAAGRSTIGFPDVSAQIRPETATLVADGVGVVEQNFDFDLLTPQKLMEKALGRTVKIVRTNPGTGAQVTEDATVLSTEQGVVLKIGDHIEVLRDDGVPTRVIFDKVPENLRARPTLSILAASTRAGARPATLTYMTTGLDWKADYVASFDDKAGTLDLQGWVTLTNTTNVAYPNAKVTVAAGSAKAASLMRGGDSSRGETGADNGLEVFALPEPVTIADRQDKQVGMAHLTKVPAQKLYRSVWGMVRGSGFFSATGDTAKAQVVLRFDAKDGEGKRWRLPRGALRAFIRDAKGDAQFVGETMIDDVAVGGKVEAYVSRAFDVEVTPRLVTDDKLGDKRWRRSVEYKVTNASDVDVTVEIEQGNLGPNARASNESVPGVQLDAYRRQWTVTVPAHGQSLVTALLEQG
jgi:hypothetical protein